MRSAVIALSLLLSLPVRASAQESAAAGPEVLTLEEAIAAARAGNRTLRNALLATRIGDDKIAEARTDRWPSIQFYALGSQLLTPIEFTFDRGTFGNIPGVGPIPADTTKIRTPLRPSFYGLQQLTQPLTQQYKIGLNIRLARLGKLVELQKLRAQKQAVTHQVKEAYYNLLKSQIALESSEANLKMYRELDRVVGERIEQKSALKSDGLDVKAHLAQEEYSNLTLQNAFASGKEQLNVILGRDIRTDFRTSPVPEATGDETDLEAARKKALGSRPELGEARLGVEQAEIARRVTKSGYIPDISLAVSNLSLTNVNLLPSNVASAGVLLTWNPLDWGRRKHELSEASLKIEQARNSAHEAEAQILAEVGARFRKLAESRSFLRAMSLTVEAQKEKVRVTTNQYEQKSALLKDVLAERASLESATSQYQQALVAFWTARAEFEKSLGED